VLAKCSLYFLSSVYPFIKPNVTARDWLECLTEIRDKSTFFSQVVVFEFVDQMRDMIIWL
jgi:hypothetical protein